MILTRKPSPFFLIILSCPACTKPVAHNHEAHDSARTVFVSSDEQTIKPLVVTDTVRFDTDDPAIWINSQDPSRSLVVGTDKDEQGGLYVFDLQGKIQVDKTISGLKRPDNVDIEYGLIINNKPVDIAVTTERLTHKLCIYSLPDMKAIDGGGLPMFEGETFETFRELMGIVLYKNPITKEIFCHRWKKERSDRWYISRTIQTRRNIYRYCESFIR